MELIGFVCNKIPIEKIFNDVIYTDSRAPAAQKGHQAEPHNHIHCKELKETHEVIFSWLSWLAVLLVGAHAQR